VIISGLVLLLVGGWWTYVKLFPAAPITPTNHVIQDQGHPDRVVVKIMSNIKDGPKFTQAIIDPKDVLPDQIQYLEASVEDKVGIKSVTTRTELDNGVIEELTLELIDGDQYKGRWANTWLVHNTHNATYRTTFIATNTKGQKETITLGWTDPPEDCDPPLTGDWVITDTNFNSSATCNQGYLIGSDDGNVTIADNTQVTLDNTTLVWTPGKSISSGENISISLINNAKMQKGYIFYLDNDQDGVADGGQEEGSIRKLVTPANKSGTTLVDVGGQQIETTEDDDGNKYTRQKDLGVLSRPTFSDCDPADSSKWKYLTGYPDNDGDGFGATTAQQVCTDGTLPAGYETAGNDCHDGNFNVNPEASYYSTPYTTETGGQSYDYNCDGTEEQYITATSKSYLSLCEWVGGSCQRRTNAQAGWENTVPACGQSGTYIDLPEEIDCTEFTNSTDCGNAGIETRTQSCR